MNMKKIAAVFGGVVFAFPALGLAQEPPTQPATTTPATGAGPATGAAAGGLTVGTTVAIVVAVGAVAALASGGDGTTGTQ